jgi:signal transduction histidine kinase
MQQQDPQIEESTSYGTPTKGLFDREVATVSQFGTLIQEAAAMPGDFADRLTEVSRTYQRLLKQTMTLTRLSDSTQRDLVSTSQALAEALERVQRLNGEKDSLIAMTAHDLRTPLAGIRGLAGMILDSQPGSPVDPKPLAIEISMCADRLLTMISNLLELHRLETTSLTTQSMPIALGALAKSLHERFRTIADQKQITLQVASPLENPEVDVDPVLFMRVAENLLSNAIKYSPRGCTVRIRLTLEDDQVALEVVDEGPGISEADQKKLFQKFAKLSARPTAGEPSTGLGLALAQGIATSIGGTIECRSALGHGSTFTAWFPTNGQSGGDSEE